MYPSVEDNVFEQASILRFLSDLISQQGLLKRAIEGCEACFQNEEGGLIAGWSSQELTKEFLAHSITFKHRWGWVNLYTELRLKDPSGQEVGSYRLITTLDGEPDDDYLVFDIEKEAWPASGRAENHPHVDSFSNPTQKRGDRLS